MTARGEPDSPVWTKDPPTEPGRGSYVVVRGDLGQALQILRDAVSVLESVL